MRGNPRANGLMSRWVSSAHSIPYACMSAAVGFMVGVWVVFSVVVGLVIGSSVPVVANWSWEVQQQSHQRRISIILLWHGMIGLFVTPAAVDCLFG